ncbi:hypothetical protein [Mycolicibacterium palauense]|uniref:hypothetical protein n=1 Tax=Mycolicibacterium palauense TaxID=2034511 RepID=UPI000BFF0B56|nr:hypothetical protein [Mycolicibacterium palauense]
MTITTETTTPTVTDADLDAAILAALEPTGSELVAWRSIRDKLPGDWWQQGAALTRLFECRAVYCVKIGGLNYLSLGHGVNAPGPVLGQPRELRVL